MGMSNRVWVLALGHGMPCPYGVWVSLYNEISDIDGLAWCADEGIVDQTGVAEKDGHGRQHLLARFDLLNRLHRLDTDDFGVLEARIGGLGY